jgi:hypothetical protein
MSDEALRAIKRMDADPELVKNLPLGAFISYDRIAGGTRMGRVF